MNGVTPLAGLTVGELPNLRPFAHLQGEKALVSLSSGWYENEDEMS